MNETASENSVEEKPVIEHSDEVKFPPFPEPSDCDFDDDIVEEERNYYKEKFKDLNIIKTQRLHCTACDRHLGCAPRNEPRMRPHPMLRTLVCHTCHNFYNSGEFEKGDDGSELYCRWCGQGGQVYCCSDCPHVFCAKCIRRNLGVPKIKEIEQTDDWKCFKCSPSSLWDLRAACWALLRYCDQKNKIAYNTQDPELKNAYQKDCAIDYSECCKNKAKKKESNRKKELDNSINKSTASIISKISPAIQVKKFASIVPDDRPEKKQLKRPVSPKQKPLFIKNPMALSAQNILSPVMSPPQAKKMRMSSPSIVNPVRFGNDKKPNSVMFPRLRSQKTSGIPILPQLNGSFNNQNFFNHTNPFISAATNDNINLSLENLTQGLDMSGVPTMSVNNQDDDVVCTPDFPLEPLCEVNEDNTDDDVQCMTPGPVAAPKITHLPNVVSRVGNILPDLTPNNIVQMSESDVTVNPTTGGLKFRVDPQTLSSNKMYRLPDGRIFAINANPKVPGSYSATIVAISENTQGNSVLKGITNAAKPSAAITLPHVSTTYGKTYAAKFTRSTVKRNNTKIVKVSKRTETSVRECDMNVPVEWFRHNLIDAVHALEYSLSRLHKIKKEATTSYLRSRSVSEMQSIHNKLDSLLNTTVSRFNEIKDSVNKEMKQYISRKIGISGNTSDEDDDVEILSVLQDNDPIFIDENSVDSNVNESEEVDLTATSSHSSPEKSTNINNNISNVITDGNNIDTDSLNSISGNNAIGDYDEGKSRKDDEKENDNEIPNDEMNDDNSKSVANEKEHNGNLLSQLECKEIKLEKEDVKKKVDSNDGERSPVKGSVSSDVSEVQRDVKEGAATGDSNNDAAVLVKISDS